MRKSEKEALIKVKGYKLKVVSVSRIQGNKYQATIEIKDHNNIRETVVEFIADL